MIFGTRRAGSGSKQAMKPSRSLRLVPLVAVVLAAACSSSHSGARTTTTTAAATTTTTSTSTTSGPATTASPTPTTVSAGAALPAGFSVFDLTWVSTDEGWALGVAPCTKPPCTSVAHTLDGGKTWAGLPAPKAYSFSDPPAIPADPPCTKTVPCVQGMRFADAKNGYAYGATSLWLTTDGGHTWAQKSSDATAALEIARGTVVRVTPADSGCPPGCNYVVQTAAAGSTSWHTLAAPKLIGDGAALALEGSNIYVAAFGHTAGGAQDAHSQMIRSTDGGAHWAGFADPCGATASGNEADTTAITAAPGGAFAVGCTPRAPGEAAFVVLSADAGATFGPHRGNLLPAVSVGGERIDHLAAATGQRLAVVVVTDVVSIAVSNDSGSDWNVTHTDTAANGAVRSYVGFQDSLTGRAILVPRTILTTTDGGGHWTGYTFG
jgi:hypothetical protein